MAKNAPTCTYVVRISALAAEMLVDVRRFENVSLEEVTKFALMLFEALNLCHVFVWSVEDDATVISLTR